MIKIKIRKVSLWIDVHIEGDDTCIDLGFMNKTEAAEVRKELEEAIDCIESFYPTAELREAEDKDD